MSSLNNKSLSVAYFMWLIGGFIGLHHLYLGRDRHAFIWWITGFGYFGLGVFRDFWHLPRYVKEVNEDTEYVEQLISQMKTSPKPPSSFVRNCGYIIVGDILGYLAMGAIPGEFLPEDNPWVTRVLNAIFVPLACAIGVHLVGNVGRHEGNIKYALIGAYITSPVYFFDLQSVFITTMTSYWMFTAYGVQWKRTAQQPKPTYIRVAILVVCLALFLSLWTSWIMFNCTLEERGEKVMCRDALKNVWNSPIWQEFGHVMAELWISLESHSWNELWDELIKAFDPQGERNSLKVLELNDSATQEEITKQYRKFAKQWHPDRHHDPIEKAKASDEFMKVQQAYETLSNIKKQRMERSELHHRKARSAPTTESNQYSKTM